MKTRDKRKRIMRYIKIEKDLYKELQLICIELDIIPSEYIEKLLDKTIRGTK